MRKLIISAVFAVVALMGAAPHSFAATVPLGTLSSGINPFPIGNTISVGGHFTDEYIFTIGAGHTAVLEAAFGQATNISGLSISLKDASNQIYPTNISFNGGSFASQAAFNLVTGVYKLLVQGTATATPASYFGSLNVHVAAVPLPGALLLMGTVLMGGAGLARWRKTQNRLAV